MTVISSVKTYLASHSGLKTGAPLWVNFLGSHVKGYSVIPLAGVKKLEEYIDAPNHYLAEYPFAFQSMESTADELARLEALGFFEAFSDWLDTQTAASMFPTMTAKQIPELIEATGQAYLYEQGQSSSGVYQIQCRLVYEQLP